MSRNSHRDIESRIASSVISSKMSLDSFAEPLSAFTMPHGKPRIAALLSEERLSFPRCQFGWGGLPASFAASVFFYIRRRLVGSQATSWTVES
ncbi:unnamed protein product [Mycena citricolor]|nr:unnamed protein product [Mycena citricolor]